MLEFETFFNKYFNTKISLQKPPQKEVQLQEAKLCLLCEERFSFYCDKVRDHDHLTGKYSQLLIIYATSTVNSFVYPTTFLGMIVIKFLSNSYPNHSIKNRIIWSK